MVLGPWCEGERQGVEGLGVQRFNSNSCPGEGERSSPFAGPWQAAGVLCQTARLQTFLKVDVWFLCQV